MRYLSGLFAVLWVAPLAAQPSINASGIVNAASYSPAGMPNAAIAQGALFIVFGQNLGPAALLSATYPLPLTLGGTSAQLTVGGTTVSPYMVYTSAGQIALLLPSSTPPGSGVLTISYNGQASAPAAVQVTSSSFGIFSWNQGGSGPAVVTAANYTPISVTNPASPGQTLVLWGTGLGKIAADESQPPPQGNVGPKPTVWVGSQPAEVAYWGRSGCCAGLDQINFQVPAGLSGCYVPLAVQTGSTVSNFGSLAIGAAGRGCSDSAALGAAELTLARSGQNLNVATLALLRSTVSLNLAPPAPASITTDSGSASFLRYTPAQLSSSSLGQTVSRGACMVFPLSGAPTVTDPVQPLGLDAGAVTLGGSNGTKTLSTSPSSKGFYASTLGSSNGPPSLYLDPAAGPHTFNSLGGADLGPFIQELSMPPALTWVNQAAVSPVSESQGVTVNWTNAPSEGDVQVTGYSFSLDPKGNFAAGAAFFCLADPGPGGAGQFTVPPPVLLSLPLTAGSNPAMPSGFLGIGSRTSPQQLPPIRGIDAGFAQASVQTLRNVIYAP